MANDSDNDSSSFRSSTTDDTSWANYILQLLAIGLTVLFGVYTAISYPRTKASLQQAEIANQLSLLSFCSLQTENSSWTASSATALQNLNLTAIVRILVPPPSGPTSPGGSHGGLSSAQKIGLGVGLGFSLPAAIVTTFAFVVKAGFVRLHLPADSVTIPVGLV
jgi:hypothetical protein